MHCFFFSFWLESWYLSESLEILNSWLYKRDFHQQQICTTTLYKVPNKLVTLRSKLTKFLDRSVSQPYPSGSMSFNLLWLLRKFMSTLDTIPNKAKNFLMSFLHLPVFPFGCNLIWTLILRAGVYTLCPRERDNVPTLSFSMLSLGKWRRSESMAKAAAFLFLEGWVEERL